METIENGLCPVVLFNPASLWEVESMETFIVEDVIDPGGPASLWEVESMETSPLLYIR